MALPLVEGKDQLIISIVMNGQLGIAKFTIQAGAVVVRTALTRRQALFTLEKLRQALQHAIGGVVAGAEFARPILECCIMQDESCDPEEAFRDRVAELGGPDFKLAPPPGEVNVNTL